MGVQDKKRKGILHTFAGQLFLEFLFSQVPFMKAGEVFICKDVGYDFEFEVISTIHLNWVFW
jgi:hypothetical protein